MATLTNLPAQAIIDGFKGTIDFYEWMGLPVARKWPRSPGHDRSPAVQATWPIFTAAVHAWPTLSEEVHSSYREMATGSGISGRDLFIKSYIKGIYRYGKGVGMIPQCSVYLSADLLNIPSGVTTLVPFDMENFDIGGNFDTVNNRFIAPRDSRYLIMSALHYKSVVAAKDYWIAIRKNGGTIRADITHSGGAQNLTSSCALLLDLVKYDSIQIFARHLAGVNTVDIDGGNLGQWTRLEISILE